MGDARPAGPTQASPIGLPDQPDRAPLCSAAPPPPRQSGAPVWYGKSRQRFHENNRVRTLDAALSNGTALRIDLRDVRLMQTIHLPGGRPERNVTSVVLTVADVYRGSRWDDTGISELHVRYALP